MYPHPHRYDAKNFPEQEYTDVFGGTLGEAERNDRDHHTIGFFSDTSPAVIKHQAGKRMASLKTVAGEVDEMNKEEK